MPHFEKMPYDNAQLLALYADLYAITRQPLAREMGTDLAGYMSRRMIAPEGGFYTAEDADVSGKEGETYLWTRAEITSVFGPADADRFMAFYELTPLPTEPTGPGVLRIRKDRPLSDKSRANLVRVLAELAPLRSKLLEVRSHRLQRRPGHCAADSSGRVTLELYAHGRVSLTTTRSSLTARPMPTRLGTTPIRSPQPAISPAGLRSGKIFGWRSDRTTYLPPSLDRTLSLTRRSHRHHLLD